MKSVAVIALLSVVSLGCEGDEDENAADAAAAGGAGGMGGEGGMGGGEPPAPPFGQESDLAMAAQLWTTLQGRGAWDGFPGVGDDVVPSKAPHSGYAIILANAEFGDGTAPAAGAIVVKDNLADEEATTLDAVTAMWKVEGFNSDEDDWFWAKYRPDGSLFMNAGGVAMAGKVGKGGTMGCIPCHAGAGGGDFLFSND